MNKKLLALAIAAAASVPLAAQADVTVYGRLHLSYDNVDTGVQAGGTNAKNAGIVSNNSRLGVKGSENLGDGLKAIFQIESAVDASQRDNATSSYGGQLGTRNTYVGMAGSWGKVRVGRFDTPYKRAMPDPFADTLGDANNIMGANGTGKFGTNFDQRLDGSAGYDGSFNNFNFAAQIGTAGSTGATSGNSKYSSWGMSVDYNGFANADIGVAFEKHNNILTSTGDTARATKLFGTYTFTQANNLKVGAVYERLRSDYNTTSDRKDWLLNASMPFAGNNHVMVEYAKAQEADNSPNTGAKLEAVGVSHNFSKRTSLYAEYARVQNDSGAKFGLGADHGDGSVTYSSSAAGQTVKGFSVGMIHNF